MSVLRLFVPNLKVLTKNLIKPPDILCKAGYAAGKLKGKMMSATQKKTFLEVETDPYKLCNFVCGANYFKEGEDPPIKPDSEYPEWLFSLHIDRKPIELSELSKDDMYYWRRLRRINMRRQNKEIKYAGQRRPKRIW
ncbi:large ribosomal subunit protein mL54-like [Mytilus galloprovincialis]|uniref:Large ribosomal subunit protein mL54 n=1 Tax=Mytilus galloprovincialis TaxID=29158 RepID=A0A8B6EVT5_MYTGA|nr:large subunit ribosomal protein L54 [Mytilus galloprovincialis]